MTPLLALLPCVGTFVAHAGRRHDMPPSSVTCIRLSDTLPHRHHHCLWEPVDREMVPRVMERYFAVKANASQSCEVFLVDGVPTASMLFTEKDEKRRTTVQEFHINKGMVLLFDVGSEMRRSLYARHKTLCVRDALNRDEFLLIP